MRTTELMESWKLTTWALTIVLLIISIMLWYRMRGAVPDAFHKLAHAIFLEGVENKLRVGDLVRSRTELLDCELGCDIHIDTAQLFTLDTGRSLRNVHGGHREVKRRGVEQRNDKGSWKLYQTVELKV